MIRRSLHLLLALTLLLVQGMVPVRAAAMQAAMTHHTHAVVHEAAGTPAMHCHEQMSETAAPQSQAGPACGCAGNCHCPDACGAVFTVALALAAGVTPQGSLERLPAISHGPAAAHQHRLLRPPRLSA